MEGIEDLVYIMLLLLSNLMSNLIKIDALFSQR